jgi:hypothetical protein
MKCPIADLRVIYDPTRFVCSECLIAQLEQIQGVRLPLFALIARCLAKVRKEKVEKELVKKLVENNWKVEVMLVCPLWLCHPWFPLLLNLTYDTPRIFRFLTDLLV